MPTLKKLGGQTCTGDYRFLSAEIGACHQSGTGKCGTVITFMALSLIMLIKISLPFYAQIFSQLSILGIRIFPRNLRDLRLMLVPQVKLIIFSFDKVRQTTKI